MVSVVGASRDRDVNLWLESLAYQDVEVILVDAGLTRGIDTTARVIEVEAEGPFPEAWLKNIGIRHATHDIVCCTNTDIAYAPNFFEEVEKHCKPGVLVQAMRVTAPPGAVVNPDATIMRNGKPINLMVDPDCESVVLPITAAGDCQALRKGDWEDLRGYNEKMVGWGGLDSELQCRALLGGYSIHTIGYSVASHVHRWHHAALNEGEDQERNAEIVRESLLSGNIRPQEHWGGIWGGL